MKQFNPIIYLLVIVFLSIFSCKPSSPPTDLSKENIIPKPVSITATGGAFQLTDKTGIYVEDDDELKLVAQYLADRLKPATGFNFEVFSTSTAPVAGNIYLAINAADPQLGTEGYELTITDDLIKLSAPTAAGLFLGIQTIRQVLPAKIELPTVQQGSWNNCSSTG